MIEIQTDRGDGQGWVPLVFDTKPDYIDSTPFSAALTRWKYRGIYRGIYRVNDAQVGYGAM